MNIEMTLHAMTRKQQQGIAADALECLILFGEVVHCLTVLQMADMAEDRTSA